MAKKETSKIRTTSSLLEVKSNKNFAKAYIRVLNKGTNEGIYLTKTQLKELSEFPENFDGIWFAIGVFGQRETVEAIPIKLKEKSFEVVKINDQVGGLNINLGNGLIQNDKNPFFTGSIAKIKADGPKSSDESGEYEGLEGEGQGTEGVSQRTPPPTPR